MDNVINKIDGILDSAFELKDDEHNEISDSGEDDESSISDSDEKMNTNNNNDEEDLPDVVKDLLIHLLGETTTTTTSTSTTIVGDHSIPLPVAAMKCLLEVIRKSRANTMMQLEDELRSASEQIVDFAMNSNSQSASILLGGRSSIALASGCELFLKYVTRTFLELPSFEDCISQVLERAEQFANLSLTARSKIASLGHPFIQDGQTVLTHGYSRVVMELLLHAATFWKKQFTLYVLEGRPDAGGAKMGSKASIFSEAGIPTTVVLDSAMAYVMERFVDLVIVGAEAVVENGGIVNKIGTYSIGIVAKELGKPFYVAAESYKFARLFPLNQADLPQLVNNRRDDGKHNLSFVDTTSCGVVEQKQKRKKGSKKGTPSLVELPEDVEILNPTCDFTPAKYISLLFTDLGVFTPSAVSDELIRLYQ